MIVESLLDREPWLRGPVAGVHPLVAPTLHAYAQARDMAMTKSGHGRMAWRR